MHNTTVASTEERRNKDSPQTPRKTQGKQMPVSKRSLCHLLPPLLEDGGNQSDYYESFRIDNMDRRRRNNNPGLDMADINGLLARQTQKGEQNENEEEEEKQFPKYGSADEFYDLADEIGKGAYGIVKKCVEKATGRVCAAKVITTSNSNLRKETMREIEMMRLLGAHKKLVSLLDAYHTPFEIVMVLEFIAGGELFERIIEEDYLMEEDAIDYVHQVLQALEFMHSKEIVHLDLKPENIMCESKDSNKIKLVDFGLARQLKEGEEVKSSFGTPDFVAPEVIRMKPVSKASDSWSLGVVTYVLLSGLMPFSGDNDHETLVKVAKADWDFDDDCFDDLSEDAMDFIKCLLMKDPSKRLTVEECLDHPWIKAQHEELGKIDTKKHKSFLAKRRWKKSINALVAVRRMSLSPLLSRARRASMDTALKDMKINENDDFQDRKSSIPSNISKSFFQRSFTESNKSTTTFSKEAVMKMKENADSRESSFDEIDETKTPSKVEAVARKPKNGIYLDKDIDDFKKKRSHTVSRDSSGRTELFEHVENNNKNKNATSCNVKTSEAESEINNNIKVYLDNGIEKEHNSHSDKSAEVVCLDEHVVLKIDPRGLKSNLKVTHGVPTIEKEWVTPKWKVPTTGLRSHTAEENYLILPQKITVHLDHNSRARSNSFGSIPSIVLNDNVTPFSPKAVSVTVSPSTSEQKLTKFAVCTTETTIDTRPCSDAHVCSHSTADQITTPTPAAGSLMYTVRTVDQKGQTITVKLDGLSSLELPANRATCTHMRRASTGSDAIEFLIGNTFS